MNHRSLLIINGDHREQLLLELFGQKSDLDLYSDIEELVTLGVNSPDHPFHTLWEHIPHINLSWSHHRVRLGGTESLLLIDLNQGCDPDALAATLGSVKGGGLIIFLMPSHPPKSGDLKSKLSVWPHHTTDVGHSFWDRIWVSLQDSQYFIHLHEHVWMSRPNECEPNDSKPISPNPTIKLPSSLHTLIQKETHNIDQYNAVINIISSHQRQAFTAVSLTASRGRGKSSVLGIAAASLLSLGESDIYITAPTTYACEAVFERAYQFLYLSGCQPIYKEDELSSKIGYIRFITPLELWARSIKFKTLFVDEAAMLPLPFLERLLEQKPSIVFSTTTHGYEGTGRGFSLRFRPFLQRKLRKLYEPKLTSPIRWSDNDPVEAWTMRVFLLEVTLNSHIKVEIHDQINHEVIDTKQLATQPSVYEQIFALLINAHYRTQPSDLWRLLDSPNIRVHILYQTNQDLPQHKYLVLAAAIVSTEGNLSPQLSATLYEGRHRPRGQLFAANFAVHLNCEAGATMSLNRIVRIATLPLIQSQGLGTRLLQEVKQYAETQGIDILGSSFGATHQLARFWTQSGFLPLRISVRQSPMSGERSLLVARGLSDRGIQLLDSLAPELYEEFSEQVFSTAKDLSPELVFHVSTTLSRYLDQFTSHFNPTLHLSERQWKVLGAVAFSGRAYELAAGPARKLVLHWLFLQKNRNISSHPLTPLSQLLIMKIIQGQRWLEVTQQLNVGSTSEVMKGLSTALRLVYTDLAPNWAQEWIKRFPQYEYPSTLSHTLQPKRLKPNVIST